MGYVRLADNEDFSHNPTMLENISAWREAYYGSVNTSEGVNHDL